MTQHNFSRGGLRDSGHHFIMEKDLITSDEMIGFIKRK